jgi:hypothetical protein
MCQFVPVCASLCQFVPVCASLCQFVGSFQLPPSQPCRGNAPCGARLRDYGSIIKQLETSNNSYIFLQHQQIDMQLQHPFAVHAPQSEHGRLYIQY